MGPWCSVLPVRKKIVAELGHSDCLKIYVGTSKIYIDPYIEAI